MTLIVVIPCGPSAASPNCLDKHSISAFETAARVVLNYAPDFRIGIMDYQLYHPVGLISLGALCRRKAADWGFDPVLISKNPYTACMDMEELDKFLQEHGEYKQAVVVLYSRFVLQYFRACWQGLPRHSLTPVVFVTPVEEPTAAFKSKVVYKVLGIAATIASLSPMSFKLFTMLMKRTSQKRLTKGFVGTM